MSMPNAPIETLEALRAEHGQLLKKSRDPADPPVGLVTDFLQRAKALGRRLDDPLDREAAQSVLDYWTATLYTLPGGVATESALPSSFAQAQAGAVNVVLDEFDPDTLRSAIAQADDRINRQTKAGQVLARRIMLRLVRLSGDGQTFDPVPATRGNLDDLGGTAEEVDEMIEELSSAGVIRVKKGRSSETDTVELRSAQLLTRWPRFADWLDGRRKARWVAENWKRAGEHSVWLGEEPLGELRSYHDLNRAERQLLGAPRFYEAPAQAEATAPPRAAPAWSMTTHTLLGLTSLAAAIGLIVGSLAYRPRHQPSPPPEAHYKRLQPPGAYYEPLPPPQFDHPLDNPRIVELETEAGSDKIRELSDANERLKRLLAEKESLTTQLSNRAYQQFQVEAENYKLRWEKTESIIVSPSLARDPKLRGQWRLWRPGVALKVHFLDGDEGLKGAVRDRASEWCRYANIKFDFDAREADAAIRVTFGEPGSWSAIGVDALTIARGAPTINLGEIRDTSPDEQARVIRHEFGHVLGLIHEWQSPNATINWDKQKVFAYYSSPPNNWSPAMIEQTLLSKCPEFKDPEYRPFDPKSIMMFPFPMPEGLADISFGVNQDLSESDKRFVAQLYPK
jgi:hypothetical protein